MAIRTARALTAAILVCVSAAVLAQSTSYTIKDGDTLFSIAKKNGVPVDILCAYNGIDDPGRLKAGAQIRFPAGHTVVKGETLYGIAKVHEVPLADLLALNKLRDTSAIRAGDTLFLPAGSNSVAVQPKASVSSVIGAVQAARVLPHPGKYEPFLGKIPGLMFHGAKGDVVVSATSGEVEWVAPYWGWGKVVIIHGDEGMKFIYAGNEDLLVNVGDRVKAGSEIAHLGVSPQGGGARLYFSIQAGTGQSVNPEKFFSKS